MTAVISKIGILEITALVAVTCMLSVCLEATIGNGNGEESANEDSSFFITSEDLGISDNEMDTIFQNLGFDTIYIFADDNGELYAETSVTTDNGRNGVERIHDGIRIYLSSDSVNIIMSGGAGALGAIIGSMITPLVGTVVGGALMSMIATAIINAVMNGLDWNDGITVDVKLYRHRHFMGVTFKTPVNPEITHVGRQ